MLGKIDTRDQIINTALAIFSEKGYEAASTRDIAERAGVNHITLFRHFGSKENLFREVLESQLPISLLTDEHRRQLTGSLREDLTYLAQTHLDIHLKNLDFVRIGIMEVPRNPSCAQIVHKVPTRLEEHLAKYLADLASKRVVRDANFKLLARMFYGQLFQHVMMICSFGDDASSLREQSNELIRTLVAMFSDLLEIKST